MSNRNYTKDLDNVRMNLEARAIRLGYNEVEEMMKDEEEHFKLKQDYQRSQGL